MNLREAAQQALEAMLNFPDDISDEMFESITALKAALAEHYCDTHCTWSDHAPGCDKAEPEGDALTAAYMLGRYDGKRKPLTTEEVEQLWAQSSWQGRANIGFARAIEKAHGIGV